MDATWLTDDQRLKLTQTVKELKELGTVTN